MRCQASCASMSPPNVPREVPNSSRHYNDWYDREIWYWMEVWESPATWGAVCSLPGLLQQFLVRRHSKQTQPWWFKTILPFSYATHAISVRTGGVLPIEECKRARSLKNDPNHWQTLCIEEPFDLTNTARSTYDCEIFSKIKGVFFSSWYLLKESRNLSSVFNEPFFSQHPQQPVMSQFNQIKYVPVMSSYVKSWGMIALHVMRRVSVVICWRYRESR